MNNKISKDMWLLIEGRNTEIFNLFSSNSKKSSTDKSVDKVDVKLDDKTFTLTSKPVKFIK